MNSVSPASTSAASNAPAVRVSWPHAVLAALGLAVSSYAVYAHVLIKRGEDAGCGLTETISCDKVLASRWGEILGVPLGIYGLVFFVIVLLTAINTNPAISHRRAAGLRLAAAVTGFLVSAALSYISFAVIGAACPVCMATHTTTLLLLLVSLWEYFKARKI